MVVTTQTGESLFLFFYANKKRVEHRCSYRCLILLPELI